MVGRNFVMEKEKDGFLSLVKGGEGRRKKRERSREYSLGRVSDATVNFSIAGRGCDGAVSSGDDRNPSRNNSISGRTTTDYTTTTPYLPGSADR